jgi:iron-sulfur cluster assembly protein
MALTLTQNAVEAIKTMVRASADANGVRITSTEEERTGAYQIYGAALPGADDEVIEENGARVFLEPRVARELGGMALDAQVDVNQQVAFLLVQE